MSRWFECKVRYQKRDEGGKERKVNEPYLVDGVSFTDAESRIMKEMESYISGEFSVTNIKLANYSEIFPNENGDRWFKCRVSFMTIDEEKGIERRANSYMLVQANNLKEAYEFIEDEMKGSVSDFQIPLIAESPIMDIFPYLEKKDDLNGPLPGNLTPLNNKDEEEG